MPRSYRNISMYVKNIRAKIVLRVMRKYNLLSEVRRKKYHNYTKQMVYINIKITWQEILLQNDRTRNG